MRDDIEGDETRAVCRYEFHVSLDLFMSDGVLLAEVCTLTETDNRLGQKTSSLC